MPIVSPMQTVGPSRAVGDAAAAETGTDAAGEVAEAHPHVPIGPQPMEKKERGNLRKRTDASGAGMLLCVVCCSFFLCCNKCYPVFAMMPSVSLQELMPCAGEEAAAQEPAAKRLHKVALSHLGDEDEADTS